MLTNETKEYIIINVPTNLKLENLFPTYQENLAKVEWLINQINHFSIPESDGYTINIKKHNWLFSSANITGKIISTLLENKIIYCSKRYVKGEGAKAYKMVNPCKEDKTTVVAMYAYTDPENPKFIKRYIADGNKVTTASTTLFVDDKEITTKVIKPVADSSNLSELEILKEEFIQMKKELLQLKIENKKLKDNLDIAVSALEEKLVA